jgi:hypothetical protein
MRFTAFIFIAFLVQGCQCGPPSTQELSSGASGVKELMTLLNGGHADSVTLTKSIEDIKTLAKKSPQQQQTYLLKIAALLENRPNDDDLADYSNRMADLIREGFDVYPNSIDFQLSGLLAIQQISFTVSAIDPNRGGDPFRKETHEKMRALLKRFPKEARVYASAYGTLSDVSERERIGFLETCLEIDSDNKFCQETFDSAKSVFEAPFCEGSQIKGSLTFRAAYKKARKGTTLLKYDGLELHVGQESIISNKHIESIRESVYNDGFSTIPQWSLVLTPQGRKVFGVATSTLIGQTIAVFFDERIVMAPFVQMAITDGRISLPPPLPLANICGQMTTRVL